MSPKSDLGKLFYVGFSMLAIPFMLTLLVVCGGIMTSINSNLFHLIQKGCCGTEKYVSTELFE